MSTENSFSIKVDLLIVTTFKKWINNNNYIVFLGNNNGYKSDGWTFW